jgi:hypothetical protein
MTVGHPGGPGPTPSGASTPAFRSGPARVLRAAFPALPALLGLLVLPLLTVPLQAQSWATSQFERKAQGVNVERLRVEVNYGAGTFRLGPTEGAEHLYRARVRFDEEQFTPVHEFSGGNLTLGTRGREGSGRRISVSRSADQAEFDLRLGRGIPISLEMNLGAVRSELELGGIPLTRVELANGAAETTLRVSAPNPATMETILLKVGAASFSGSGMGRLGARNIDVEAGLGEVRLELDGLTRPETDVRVSMGLGSLELLVPQGVGIEVQRSGFLTSMNAPGLERQGSRWVSPDWETAPARVRVLLSAALGSVSIQRLP